MGSGLGFGSRKDSLAKNGINLTRVYTSTHILTLPKDASYVIPLGMRMIHEPVTLHLHHIQHDSAPTIPILAGSPIIVIVITLYLLEKKREKKKRGNSDY